MSGDIEITVDRAKFLEVARMLQRNRRAFHAAKVMLALENGELRIEFENGGCVLPCACPQRLTAVMAAPKFAGIAVEHRHEKTADQTIQLTFRPNDGIFATRLAGVKAKITLRE
jgi:hypothetical protein